MEFDCPNCKKPVRLVLQRDITEEFGYGPNPVAYRRKKGEFPEPVLDLENRLLWLREDIEEYVERDRRGRIEQLVQRLDEELSALPETEREEARELLLEQDHAGHQRRKRRS